MAIVGGEDLHEFMSRPQWSEQQMAEADRLCARLEQSLADALGAPIDPIPWSETAVVLASGLVATRYPVSSVQEIGGVSVPADTALPDPWILAGRWVRLKAGRTVPPGASTAGGVSVTSSELDGLAGLAGFGEGTGRPLGLALGRVDITYRAGWGRVGTLELAVLHKAEAVFGNRNDDTVELTSGTGATRTTPRPRERWTREELESPDLQFFRNLHLTR